MNAAHLPAVDTTRNDQISDLRAALFQFAVLKNNAYRSGLIAAATRDQIQRDIDDAAHALDNIAGLIRTTVHQTIYKHGGSRIWTESGDHRDLLAHTYHTKEYAIAIRDFTQNWLRK